MKIAFISRWFVEEHNRTAGRGGTEQQRVRAYQEAGHEVIVLSQAADSTVLESREFNGLSVVTTPRWKRAWWLAAFDKLLKPWSHHRKVCTDAWHLRAFLQKFGPFDVLEAQCEEPDGLVCAFGSLFTTLPPWCIQLFALRYSFAGREPRFEQASSLGFAFRRATLVKANSQLVASLLEKHYGCPSSKIIIVHPNLELPEAWPSSAGLSSATLLPVVLCIGALTPTKGIQTFVEAVKILPKSCASFQVAGGPGEDAAFAQNLTQQGIAEGIKFLGHLDRPALFQQILASQVIVIPSLFDAWNRAAIEAAALGRPVIISDHCGAANWIKIHPQGLVFPAGDHAALAQTIQKVLADPSFSSRATAAAPLARSHFSTPIIARANLDVFDRLVKS